MTVSLEKGVADYLRSTRGVSSTVEEAVTEYRARVLERELEQAYRDGAKEAQCLDAEWRYADAKVEE